MILRAENIIKTYGKRTVVKGVSFDVKQGEIVGLLGPNGQPLGPASGNTANVPGGMPVSGNVPGPNHGMPRPALPARGPGSSPFDAQGMPMS